LQEGWRVVSWQFRLTIKKKKNEQFSKRKERCHRTSWETFRGIMASRRSRNFKHLHLFRIEQKIEQIWNQITMPMKTLTHGPSVGLLICTQVSTPLYCKGGCGPWVRVNGDLR
jgi:hypothetical protein